MIRSIFISIVLTLAFVPEGVAQLRDSSRNAISVGIIQDGGGNNNVLLSYERKLKPKVSAVLSVGIMPSSKGVSEIQFLSYHLSIEGRYYFCLRRNLPLSGFFIGPYASYSEGYGWYIDSGKKAVRSYYTAIGLGIGYQHVFCKKLRATIEANPVYPRVSVLETWDRAGLRRGRFVWPFLLGGFISASVGFSF